MATRRRYYDDSFEREFTAKVVNCCEPMLHGTAPAWEVLLDSTAFYPNSGGQPHDEGRLGEANVLDVRDEGEEIVHVVDRELERGSVRGCIDWTRRFDHMQQHTGQHLLSAMFQERFGRPTVSFHLGSEVCTIDLRGPELSEEILEGAERAANQVIFEDRPVTVRYGTAEQLAQLGVRKEVDRSGILRAIEIEGADLQACGGTHVKCTAQIGVILVRKCAKIRQDWRVEFVCGRRAERVARQDYFLLRRVAERLNCATDDVVEATERVLTERDAHFKNARATLQRLAESEAALQLQATPPGPDGTRLIARVFSADVPPEYLGQFAAQIAKSEKTIALLAAAAGGHLIFAQHTSAGQDMNSVLKQILQKIGGKGGGTPDFARGRLDDAAQGEKALDDARELLFGRRMRASGETGALDDR
jgi:alanyl-tRNA synthetase